MKEPILIVLVLFVVVGLAYSPLKNAKSNRVNTNDPAKTSSSVGETNGNLGNSSNKEIAENIKEAKKEIEKLEKSLNEEIAKSKRSPYYGKINMSNISGLRQTNPDKEYISLSTNIDKNEAIKITGWFLKSEVTGYYMIIGKAALLPFPFTKTESDVILNRDDKVYLIKGFSPIGISFRTNKCTGYFEENRTFTPSLPKQCPRAKNENLPTFSNVYDRNDECIKLIERIPRCTTKGNEFIRDLPDTISLACKNYITTQINYNTCVATHLGDTDFPGNQYRIYLNKFGPFWRTTHDTINLHDENGLIVDSISY
ncbi:MAG: hypothetical protein COV33_00855 [Candidatus Zambryskibacteria bacterium CG10_big_fil_rev_8_21_14_0_10_34_34]|uniref:LTD domain-containing protein n=1 Tax=Candidatus Zambryskibacteria bacterium CG10_big_fil_rev_8_21_14_0_10_34_34 TaxID=1975114 RepID=A0A2H0R138_9BACT|nr:MAG: hypothetical protein COV33_00855 [Candidatus Zambryskibacteria bacterium CG10_big_fil_rev_8_21_14_0_10_34_34]